MKHNWSRWIQEDDIKVDKWTHSTEIKSWLDSRLYKKNVRYFVFIQSLHTFFSLLRVCSFLLLSRYCALFPSLLGITRKTDQYETLKLVYAVNFEICVELNTHYTYTLAVCSFSTYLCAPEICVISLLLQRAFLQREPSQRSMPNWHHTVVLSTLSC